MATHARRLDQDPHVESDDGPTPLTEDEFIEGFHRLFCADEDYGDGPPYGPEPPPRPHPTNRRPLPPRPHRRSRSRESHRTRAGHRRATSARGRDGGDDDGPSDPEWPRRVAAHLSLDLAAGQSRVVVVPDLGAFKALAAALDAAGVDFAATIHDNDGRLAVEFVPDGAAA